MLSLLLVLSVYIKNEKNSMSCFFFVAYGLNHVNNVNTDRAIGSCCLNCWLIEYGIAYKICDEGMMIKPQKMFPLWECVEFNIPSLSEHIH